MFFLINNTFLVFTIFNFFYQNLYKDDSQLCYNRINKYTFLIFLLNVCKITINGFSHYIQCIYKLVYKLFLGQHVIKKRSLIMGAIIDTIFIIIYTIS